MKIHFPYKTIIGLVALLLLLGVAGCLGMPQVSKIEGEEREQVLAAAEPIADSLFTGMNEKDYAAFSRDFDETMKKSLNEKSFDEMINLFTPAIGMYESREVMKVEKIDTIYVVSYNARFTEEEVVSVRLNIREGDPPQVAGLWFDSPKLRKGGK